jgi:NADPH-dependent FMN reductase
VGRGHPGRDLIEADPALWPRSARRPVYAYVIVLPEYNYGFNAAIKNAIDYLNAEWQHKPVGLVSYGGLVRLSQALRPLREPAAIPAR